MQRAEWEEAEAAGKQCTRVQSTKLQVIRCRSMPASLEVSIGRQDPRSSPTKEWLYSVAPSPPILQFSPPPLLKYGVLGRERASDEKPRGLHGG